MGDEMKPKHFTWNTCCDYCNHCKISLREYGDHEYNCEKHDFRIGRYPRSFNCDDNTTVRSADEYQKQRI